MEYNVLVSEFAAEELKAVKPFFQRQIADAIDQQLLHEPTTPTRNRKCLGDVLPDFEHQIPLWELRVGEYRVYYNVSEESATVSVCSVRRKPPHVSTEQVV